jgi:lipopolysaccharide export system permease protein
MKVLTRYFLRSLIGPFFFAFFALTSVLLINVIAKELANLAGKGLPFDVVAEFFILSLPANIALTLPMAVLVAVLYAFSTFASENEISALRASGVDLRRATIPVIVAACFIAIGMAWFNDRVLPASNFRWRVLMTDVAQTRPLRALRPQTLNSISTSDGGAAYFLEAHEVDPATGFLRDVTIIDVSNPSVTRTINADSGTMAFNQARTDLLLTLHNGNVREVNFDEFESYQLVEFGSQVMRIQGVSEGLERNLDSQYRTDRDMTSRMMAAAIDTLRMQRASLLEDAAKASEEAAEEERMAQAVAQLNAAEQASAESPDNAGAGVDVAANRSSADAAPDSGANVGPEVEKPLIPGAQSPSAGGIRDGELARFSQTRIDNIDFQIREYQIEIQKKFSIAGATLVFVLLGIPLALRFPRGGIGMVVATSLMIFGIYYVGLIGGESLGDRGYVPPIVAMWLTNAIFGILGIIGFALLGREQGTGRGSGWGDAPRLPGWLRRRLNRTEAAS